MSGQADSTEQVTTVDLQATLFDGDFSPLPEDLGFRGPVACGAAGITYRQRLYSFRDILLLKVIKRLLDAGISLQQIRLAIDHLRKRGVQDLTQVTLLSDGFSVYECTSNNEIIDLLNGGQGMFAIALGGVWRDLEGSLAELPTERAEQTPVVDGDDELSRRRRQRLA